MQAQKTSSGYGSFPNLIIIGAGKCGTSSLHYYLDQHPQIAMSREKELNFFSDDFNWKKGPDWYSRHFRAGCPIRGESSPFYTNIDRSATAARRMAELLPDTKLCYILRDPVQRLVSNYIQDHIFSRETRTISQVLSRPAESVHVRNSMYFKKLAPYLKHFDRRRLLIITLEELSSEPRRTMQRMFGFLEVDQNFDSPRFARPVNVSSAKGRLSKFGLALKWMSDLRMARVFSTDLRRRVGRVLYRPFTRKMERPELDRGQMEAVRRILQPDIDRLRRFTGRDYSAWSI